MATDDVFFDPSWMQLESGFNEQVATIFHNVRLSRDEVNEFRLLFRDVEDTLRTNWPGCEVFPFGSIVTGLGIKTSDVDCYVHIPAWYRTPGDKFVIAARNILRRRSNIFAQLFAITSAKVPIVKFIHIPTQRNCDLSFRSPSGVKNSKLISYLLHVDSRAQDLAILVKYWSKVHHLTGTNLMPNYALSLLVIFYLQIIEILPPVLELQAPQLPEVIDGWNTAFGEPQYTTGNDWSLYQILGGFFAFYSTYNFYDNIISTFVGYSILREGFNKLSDVPVEFKTYRENVQRKMCQPLRMESPMCVQDPFDHSRNCTVAVFPKLAHKLISHFRLAAKLHEEESESNFLLALLTRQPMGNNLAGRAPRPEVVRNQFKPQQNYRTLKRNIQRNVHTLYNQFNTKKKQKK